MNYNDLDIEPDDAEPAQLLDSRAHLGDGDGAMREAGGMRPSTAEAFRATGEPTGLASVLPLDLQNGLATLLRFVPDVRLKQKADADAAAALAIDVQAPGGLLAADRALSNLREDIIEIQDRFEDPTDLANQLHKRLTGLRADFVAGAKRAQDVVNGRLLAEKHRLDVLEARARREAQEAADKKAREDLARAAKEAAARGAPKTVVQDMKAQAKVATAPPVQSPTLAPKLESSTTVQNWKARLQGTPADAEPNPEVSDLTAAQQESVLRLLDAIRNGTVPLACILLNWQALNAQAKASKSTLNIPGIEAFDAGSVRGKARR